MVSFATKFKHTFIPRKIGSVYIKSQRTVPADYGSSIMKKNMENLYLMQLIKRQKLELKS